MAAPAVTLDDKLTLGDRLTRARKHIGASQAEIADAVGISRVSVSHYENDLREPSFATVCAWAVATGVALKYFADATTPPSSDPNGRQGFANRSRKVLPFPGQVDIDLTDDNVRPFRHHQPAPLVPAA